MRRDNKFEEVGRLLESKKFLKIAFGVPAVFSCVIIVMSMLNNDIKTIIKDFFIIKFFLGFVFFIFLFTMIGYGVWLDFKHAREGDKSSTNLYKISFFAFIITIILRILLSKFL